MTPADKTRHDLKNHLAIILGYAEILLAEAVKDSPQRASVQEIHRAATAALDLIAAPTRADVGS